METSEVSLKAGLRHFNPAASSGQKSIRNDKNVRA